MTLNTKIFQTAAQVVAFVNDGANGVGSIVSITFDSASSSFVLFYSA